MKLSGIDTYIFFSTRNTKKYCGTAVTQSYHATYPELLVQNSVDDEPDNNLFDWTIIHLLYILSGTYLKQHVAATRNADLDFR
jgi:hypothetical protein